MVQKTEGAALAMVRNLNSQGKARGVLAWYRVVREAEGQVETKRIEITEKVFDANRKQVAVKDVATAIAQWEGELREYTNMTGREAEDSLKVVHLKRMLPNTIRDMLQTVRLTTFKECKVYALEQARAQHYEKGYQSEGSTRPRPQRRRGRE